VPPDTVIGPLLNGMLTSPVVTDAQVTESGVLMVIAQPELVAPSPSVTWILNVPDVVGVPLTAPLVLSRVRPVGSVPTTEYVYGVAPPDTVIGPLLNGTLTSPVVTEAQVTDSGGATVIVQFRVPVFPALSVIVTVYGYVPLAVGVPVMSPEEEMLSPGGNPVAVKVYGPPRPPLPTSCVGVIAIPCSALMTTQLELTGVVRTNPKSMVSSFVVSPLLSMMERTTVDGFGLLSLAVVLPGAFTIVGE
jgi:hypothetical protein